PARRATVPRSATPDRADAACRGRERIRYAAAGGRAARLSPIDRSDRARGVEPVLPQPGARTSPRPDRGPGVGALGRRRQAHSPPACGALPRTDRRRVPAPDSELRPPAGDRTTGGVRKGSARLPRPPPPIRQGSVALECGGLPPLWGGSGGAV